jgi:hypothetical protein
MGKWDGIKSRKIFDATQTFSQKLLDDLEPQRLGSPTRLLSTLLARRLTTAC